MNWLMVPLVLAVGFQTPADEEKAKDGARLKAAMAATGFKYETTASGLSYALAFEHEQGKTQKVYVTIDGSQVGIQRYHSIYTGVWAGPKEPDAALIKKAMSSTKKLGHFYAFKDVNGVWSIRFMVQIETTRLPEQPGLTHPQIENLKDVLYFVDQVGFETAKQLAEGK